MMISWPDEINDRVGRIEFEDMGVSHSLCKMLIYPREGAPITCVTMQFYVRNSEKLGPLGNLYRGKLVRIIDDAIHGLDDFRSLYEQTSPEEKALEELVKKYTVSKDGGIDANTDRTSGSDSEQS